MSGSGASWLVAAGAGCLLAAAAHLAVIAGGPEWYRAFGAGERMARAAERGAWTPALMTIGIATILAVWAAYAFAGAGLFARLPLQRTALVLIALVLLVRGLGFVVPGAWRPELSYGFKLWSSLIVLALGACFAIGTWRVWPKLAPPP